jgi:hypothetical protein
MVPTMNMGARRAKKAVQRQTVFIKRKSKSSLEISMLKLN